MLDEINEVLETYLNDAEFPMERVFYGMCNENLDKWNYFVFRRVSSTEEQNASLNEYYDIHIIHENYIPRGYDKKIARSIKKATGMRPVWGKWSETLYTTKSNTKAVVEICTIHLVKALKASVMR